MKRVKFGVSRHFGRALWIFLIMVIIFLADIGHIWGFWVLSVERVGVNVKGRAEAYFRRFASSAV